MPETSNYTIYDLLRNCAEKNPEALAIVSPQRPSLTYRHLLDQVDQTIESLRSRGIARRDRVVLVLPGGPELATAFLAVSSIATVIPLNPAYRESEFDYYFSDLKPKALIVASGMHSPAAAAAQQGGIDIIELRPSPERGAGSFSLLTPRRDVAGTGDAHGDDIALVLYTSGTTSKPKRVPLSHSNLRTSAENIAASLGLTASDRCLNIMPLFHIHGLVGGLLSSLAAAGVVAIPPDFRSSSFFSWLAELQPTWYTAVPTMHDAILRGAKEQLGAHSLRFIRSSSAPLTARLMTELEATFKVPVIQAYGMTEASHQIASNPLPPVARKPGSVGMPTRTKVAVVDEAGDPVAKGNTGEVVVQGANITSGYENYGEVNQTTFIKGWFRTGDQGYFDSDGYLFLTGRLKELINRGGSKVSPLEVEAVLSEHPAVLEAIAFPISHGTLGEDVAAAVVVKSGRVLTQRDLREFAARRLADFKVPHHIEFVESIPKSATGKVQRVQLASQLGLNREGGLSSKREDFVAPRTDLEANVANAWCQVLRLDEVSVHDSFFSLGGDSLGAVEVVSHLTQSLNIDLSSVSFVDTPTVADMAALIGSLRQTASGHAPATTIRGRDNGFEFLVKLQHGQPDKPVFIFPGGNGDDSEFFYLTRLVRHLPREYTFYAFRARGGDGLQSPHSSVDEMAADYIAEIRTVQREGPYVLMGDCIGGAVAVEAARQLVASGQRIEALILTDSERPTTMKYWAYRVTRFSRDVVANLSRHWTRARRGLRDIVRGDVASRLRTHSYDAGESEPAAWTKESQNPINPTADISRAAKVLRGNMLRYKARPYDGQIKLVVNEKWFRRNATLGWGKIASRGVEAYAAPGDHLTYTEGERARTVAWHIEKWIEEARGPNGNIADRKQLGSSIESTDAPLFLTERLLSTKADLADVVPVNEQFILVDDRELGPLVVQNRVAVPFLERTGGYEGPPRDDSIAIQELERLRAEGATFVVFAWPAFWWLDYYGGLRDYLQRRFACVLRNGRVVIFDLRANEPSRRSTIATNGLFFAIATSGLLLV